MLTWYNLSDGDFRLIINESIIDRWRRISVYSFIDLLMTDTNMGLATHAISEMLQMLPLIAWSIIPTAIKWLI